MKDYPILFSAPMVRAILEGRKAQTRRVIKPQPTESNVDTVSISYCPYGEPGGRLWVRETWAGDDWTGYAYKATDPDALPFGEEVSFEKWKPSIHMPRGASRITLEIMNVRVEKLQSIDNHESWREGIPEFGNWIENDGEAKDEFARLWNKINEARGYGWNTNPWVWVIEFRKL
jgi:hypothetical protein